MPARKPRAIPKSTGTWARLKAEAEKNRPAVAPYVIDDVDPPIVIEAPDAVETQIELAECFGGGQGDFLMKDARRILELVCGDAFPRVWELVRGEHVRVLMTLILDMGAHFGAADAEVTDFPGGSAASSGK